MLRCNIIECVKSTTTTTRRQDRSGRPGRGRLRGAGTTLSLDDEEEDEEDSKSQGAFWSQEMNMTIHARSSSDNSTYQVPRPVSKEKKCSTTVIDSLTIKHSKQIYKRNKDSTARTIVRTTMTLRTAAKRRILSFFWTVSTTMMHRMRILVRVLPLTSRQCYDKVSENIYAEYTNITDNSIINIDHDAFVANASDH